MTEKELGRLQILYSKHFDFAPEAKHLESPIPQIWYPIPEIIFSPMTSFGAPNHTLQSAYRSDVRGLRVRTASEKSNVCEYNMATHPSPSLLLNNLLI